MLNELQAIYILKSDIVSALCMLMLAASQPAADFPTGGVSTKQAIQNNHAPYGHTASSCSDVRIADGSASGPGSAA